MIKAETIILFREDLFPIYQDKSFDEITINDFNFLKREVMICDILMFVDVLGRTKVLKNRYGWEGVVC